MMIEHTELAAAVERGRVFRPDDDAAPAGAGNGKAEFRVRTLAAGEQQHNQLRTRYAASLAGSHPALERIGRVFPLPWVVQS